MSQLETITASSSEQHRILLRLSACAGIIAPIFFVVVFTVAGFLHPGYSAFGQMISNLGAEQPFSWLQDANFFISGLLLIAFAIGFYQSMRFIIGQRRLTVSSILLGFVGAGLANEAFFVTDLPGQTPTLHGVLHIVGFLVLFLSLIITQIRIGRQFLKFPEWRVLGGYSIATGIATLALILLFFFTGHSIPQYVGLLNRIFVIVAFAWYVVMGWQLLKKAM